ncbi:putative metalloprotease CJM1_0395 family protein [Tateyamaria sp. SN6-1]|uniref:putative metalloprotease CJM1_0395 family protein n=1 Tax=Tateyamaria sp. SN6-1 TaxID=3092148 RepID=UPI0039F4FD0D
MIDTAPLDQGAAWAQVAHLIHGRLKAQAGDRSVADTKPDTQRTDAVAAPPPVKATDLTEAQQRVVRELAARDGEVRRHEQAHAAVGGRYASAPSYTYEVGPDGKRYAVGGEVQIDTAPVDGDPEATILKMEVVKAAALAPAEPSSADRQVAAFADALRMQAVADLAAMRREVRAGVLDHRA